MPRTPISYANTHVYKIVCRDLNSKYCCVGHTTDFKRRKSEHTKHVIVKHVIHISNYDA